MKKKNTWMSKIEFKLNEASIGLILSPEAVLKAFEDFAGKSADSLGFGWENVNSEQKVWVVNRIKIMFYEKMVAPINGLFTTWPINNPNEKYSSNRDFCIETEEGKRIADGISKWCLLDLKTRSLCKVSEVDHLITTKLRRDRVCEMEYHKIVKSENAKIVYIHKVRLADLDLNGHLNNKKYSLMAVNILSEQEFLRGIKTFEISYNGECFLDDEITVYRQGENVIETIGIKNGKIVFTAGLELF